MCQKSTTKFCISFWPCKEECTRNKYMTEIQRLGGSQHDSFFTFLRDAKVTQKFLIIFLRSILLDHFHKTIILGEDLLTLIACLSRKMISLSVPTLRSLSAVTSHYRHQYSAENAIVITINITRILACRVPFCHN